MYIFLCYRYPKCKYYHNDLIMCHKTEFTVIEGVSSSIFKFYVLICNRNKYLVKSYCKIK